MSEMLPPPPSGLRELIRLLPTSWFHDVRRSSIWLRGYRMYRLERAHFPSPPEKVLVLADVVATAMYGRLHYFDMNRVEFEVVGDHQLYVDASKGEAQRTDRGAYLLLIAPFSIDGRHGDEVLTVNKISAVAGLLAAFNGRNIVGQRLYDNVVELAEGKTSASSLVFENPFKSPVPDISDSRMNAIVDADRTIAALPEPQRNRIRLSLRWLESALYETGVDAYLKYWIALETLGMRSPGDLVSLAAMLSRGYNLSVKSAKNEFAIGHLFGLRHRIVHKGAIVPIHGALLRYMQALYADILQANLGLPCDRQAGSAMIDDDPKFGLHDYLREVSCAPRHR